MTDLDRGAERPAGPSIDPAVAAKALTDMRAAALSDANDRMVEFARKIGEVLRGGITAVKEQSPPWSLDLRADWCDDQLGAINRTTVKFRDELPEECRQRFGDALTSDIRDQLDQHMDALLPLIVPRATQILERELPDAMTHRASRPERQKAEDELERITDLESAVANARSSARSATLIALVALIVGVVGWCSR